MTRIRSHWANVLGMIAVGFGEFLCVVDDAISKFSGLSGSQLIVVDYLFQFVVCIIWWNILKCKNKEEKDKIGKWYGNKPYIKIIWLYGMIQFIDLFCFWYGIRFVPIGVSRTITSSVHLIIPLIGYFYLKEPLMKSTGITFLLIIISLILVTQPSLLFDHIGSSKNNTDFETVHSFSIFGLILVFISTLAYSVSAILLRITTRINEDGEEEEGAHFFQLQITNSVQNILIWMPLIMTLNSFSVHDEFIGDIKDIPQEWKWDTYSLFWLLLSCITGFGAISFNIIGYQLGDATKVVWFENIDLFASYFFQ